MSDSLRARIAAAIAGAVADYLSYDDAYTMADAVIAELAPELSRFERLEKWRNSPRLAPNPFRKADDE